MKTRDSKRNHWEVAFWVSNTILMIVIVILLLLLFKCKRDYISHIEISKAEIEQLKADKLRLETENALLKELFNSKANDLSEAYSLLETCIIEANKKDSQVQRLFREINELKKSIAELNSKVDFLANEMLLAVQFDVIDVPEEDFVEVNDFSLNIQVEKTSWDKKSNITKTLLLDYSAPLTFVNEEGFEKDNLYYLYKYLNENKETVSLNLTNLINEKKISLSVVKMMGNESIILLSEDKNFHLGARGLLVQEEILPIEVLWKHQYLEKIINPDKNKKGNRKIIFGSVLGATGFTGVWYFSKYPIAKIKLNRNGEEVFYDEIFNDFGKVASYTAIGIGTGSVIKGFINKNLSYTLSPCEVSLRYFIE